MQRRYDLAVLHHDEVIADADRFVGRATLAKEGVYVYHDGVNTWREFVPMSTLTDPEWLDTLRLAPVTLNHPQSPLTRDTARQFAVGAIGETVVRVQSMIGSAITIWDGTAIDAAKTTHQEISLGYECDLDPTPGTWQGQAYDAVQITRRANHVALVDRGRHGPEVRVAMDAADDADIVTLDETDEETFTPPAAVAAAAKRGLEIREKEPPSNRGGTEVGLARARQLANREAVSLSTIKRMVSFFARHEVDKKGEGWGKNSKGYQAWLLWGGDAGRRWAEGIVARKRTTVDMALATVPAFATIAHEALRLDAGDTMAAITIGNVKLDADSTTAAAAKAHLDHLEARAAEADAAKSRADRAEAERDAAKAALDSARADHEAVVAKIKADGVAAARARVELETAAKAICGRKFDCADKTDREIRVDMLSKLGVTLPEGKSDDYIAARLDAALESARKSSTAAAIVARAMNLDEDDEDEDEDGDVYDDRMRLGGCDEDDEDDEDEDKKDKKKKDKKRKSDAALSPNQMLASRWR